MIRSGLLILLLVILARTQAWAEPPFQKIAIDTYHPKAGGNVQSHIQSCQFCHAPSGAPALNLYGTDIKAVMKAQHTKMLTPAILHAVDDKDSDGDGFDNATEIAADTLPGDAASKPAGVPPKSKSPAPVVRTGEGDNPNPYDLRTLLLPKHAQHPVIVHFPIALFIISLFFDALSLLRRNSMLAATGYLNLTVAAVTAPLALITGLLAWQFAYGGISAEGFKGTLAQHLVLSVITTLLIWILWGMRFSKRPEGIQTIKTPYIILALITMIIISITGHLGGFLSGVN